jgi:hypothetical protein
MRCDSPTWSREASVANSVWPVARLHDGLALGFGGVGVPWFDPFPTFLGDTHRCVFIAPGAGPMVEFTRSFIRGLLFACS